MLEQDFGKFSQFLTTFGDMQNGWKKSFRPKRREFRDNCAPRTRGDHSDHHAPSCLTLQGSKRSAPYVFILAEEKAIDRWPDITNLVASQRLARMLDFARTLSLFQARSAAARSHPFGVRGAQRIARTFAQRMKSEGLGFKV